MPVTEQRIRLLHLEDNPRDAGLIQDILEADGLACEIARVASREAFETAMAGSSFDVILTDYTLPDYDGLSALRLAKQKDPAVPVIVISGALGEEAVVNCLQQGAIDYLLKDRLDRLGPAVKRALHEAEEERKRLRAEESLRKSEERFTLVARATSDAIWDWNPVTDKLWWGGNCEPLFGIGADEVEGDVSSWTKRVHPDDWMRVQKKLYAAIDGNQEAWTDEYRFRRKDGLYAYVADRGFVIRDERGSAIRMVGGITDLTQRKLAEERFSAIFQSSPVAIAFGTMEGLLIEVNTELCAFFGYPCDEMIGRTTGDLFLWANPEDREIAMAKVRREKTLHNHEARFRRKSGELRAALVSMEMLQFADTPMLLTMIVDIAERKALEAQLHRVQRVESVGRLASGIAHDMNNILAPIMMSAPLLRMGMSPDDVENTLSTIEVSAQRGAALVRQLMIFGRGIEGERRPVRPADIVDEVTKLAGQTFPRNITITSEVPPNAWPVCGDATQLQQVMLNLCVNARDAMFEGGTLVISAENVDIDAHYSALHSDAKPGQYVLIRVADTGAGIAPEIMERIFDPFFTTKEVGKGTGLGLSNVLGIVKSHGGFVRLNSAVGRGTTFEIHLPASPDLINAPPPKSSGAPTRGRGELILVVDDEEHIRAVLRETLARHNYKVVTAQDGVEATAVFAANRARLVVTDLDMPLMDGVNLSRVLRRMNPAVKIVISTGLGERSGADKRRAELDALGVSAILTKPYTAEKILRAVHTALTEAESSAPEN